MNPQLEEPVLLEIGNLLARVYPSEEKLKWTIIVWRKGQEEGRGFEFVGSLERAEGFATGLLVAFGSKNKI